MGNVYDVMYDFCALALLSKSVMVSVGVSVFGNNDLIFIERTAKGTYYCYRVYVLLSHSEPSASHPLNWRNFHISTGQCYGTPSERHSGVFVSTQMMYQLSFHCGATEELSNC